ncbi:MAG: alpha/beta hydrolase [Gemmataceae bacterium]
MMNLHVPAIPHISFRRSFKRRWLRRIALLAAVLSVLTLAGYGIAVAVMLSIEPSLVYMPTRPNKEWKNKPIAEIQDVTLHTGDGAMHAWYLPAEKPDLALLLCHGTGGNLSIRGQGMPEYRERFHASVLVFDYPGYGKSDGEPTEAGCYAAADAAYDFLVKDRGFKPENVVIYGESLGGGVAVDLASRRKHGALMLVNTFANLPEVAQRLYQWLPVTLLMNNRFDSESKIGKCHAPLFLTHGSADRLIPVSHSLRLFEKANNPKRYLLRDGKDHEDRLGPDGLEKIADFLRSAGCLHGK